MLLAPSTNHAYAGAPWAAHLLAVLGVLTILPGIVHVALPDGGAGSIAGVQLGACGPAIIACFAWAGATQIAFGAMMLLVALRWRPLVPVTFLLFLVERGLHAVNGWWLKPGSGHHPPEHYAVLVVLPIALAGLMASMRERA
jgi:hypothetical protein